MQENVKRYTTNSGIGTVFQVGLNYETVQPGHDFVRLGDHLAALDAVLKEAVWAMYELAVERRSCLADMFDIDSVELNERLERDKSYQHASAFLARPDVLAWRARQEGKQVAPVKVSKRTCNRHDDCDEADQKCGQGGATHCRVDDCEDCFGK